LLTLGIVITSASLICALMYPLESRASNDSRSELTDSMDQNPRVEFNETMNISNNTQDSVYGQVRSFENNIYVVWQESVPDLADGNYEIFFKKSNNTGKSFEREIRLSNNSGFSEHPQMAAEDENIYVVWADNTNVNKQIYFRKSIDGGKSFDEQMLLSNSNSNAFNQEISSFGKNVHIVWLEKVPNGPYRTMTTSSTDGGETFQKPIVLSENASALTFPKISTYDNHVYVTWNVEDEPDADNGMYFISSSDNGMTFGNISKLNTEEKDYGEPQVASAGNQVYVIWGGSDTHLLSSLNIIKSEDYGDTFSEIKKISETDLGKLIEPSNVDIAIDQNDRVFIAWQDKVNASGKDEILFAFSTDNGQTFSDVTNVSNNTDISECPSIIVTDDAVFITWEDLTPGNHEILFSRGMIV
jgi:hypothetical protein